MKRVQTKSLLRLEEYKMLEKLSINGRILDVGGSKKSGYHELLGGTHEIVVGNIDDSYGIDVVFDAEKPWPMQDGSLDAVLCMNLLEHLYNPHTALAESHRVLKREGVLVGAVPFMFNVHGSPSDYFRYTRSALERMCADAGFKNVQVFELGTGVFSVVYQSMFGFLRWSWLATMCMDAARWLDALMLRLKPDNKMSARHFPLGYYFEARK